MRPHPPATGTVALICAMALCVSCSSGSGAGKESQAKDAGDTSSSSSHARPDAHVDGRTSPGADAGMDGGADAAQGVDAAESCTQCTGSGPSGSLCVISVDAQLVDTTGVPVAGQDVTVCGLNLCGMPVTTDAQGKVHFGLCQYMTSPALKYLGRTSYVSFAAAVTESAETFPPITLFPLPAQGMPFPSGQGSVTSGSVSLEVAAGSVKFESDATERLQLARVPCRGGGPRQGASGARRVAGHQGTLGSRSGERDAQPARRADHPESRPHRLAGGHPGRLRHEQSRRESQTACPLRHVLGKCCWIEYNIP